MLSTMIEITIKSDDQLLYTTRDAARRLGIGRTELFELTAENRTLSLFSPVIKGARGRSGKYSGLQLKIITLVMREKLTKEQGNKVWQRADNSETQTIIAESREE